jgi:hypothetical protein
MSLTINIAGRPVLPFDATLRSAANNNTASGIPATNPNFSESTNTALTKAAKVDVFIDAIGPMFDIYVSYITTQAGIIGQRNETITTLSNAVNDKEGTIAAITAQLQGLGDELQTVTGNLALMTGYRDQLTTALAAETAAHSLSQTNLNAANALTALLEAQKAALEQAIAELEASAGAGGAPPPPQTVTLSAGSLMNPVYVQPLTVSGTPVGAHITLEPDSSVVVPAGMASLSMALAEGQGSATLTTELTVNANVSYDGSALVVSAA